MLRVTHPLDQVFEMMVAGALVKDGFDFILFMVVNGDHGGRRGSGGDMIRDGGQGGVGSEEADMEDWVDVQ
jgi:hypothetical protein